MDKFVIGRVATAIDYPVDPAFDQVRCRHRMDDAAELVLHGGPFLQHSIIRGCAAPRECTIGRSYRFTENNASVSCVAANLSSEEALVAPIDTKVSIDTIVQ